MLRGGEALKRNWTFYYRLNQNAQGVGARRLGRPLSFLRLFRYITFRHGRCRHYGPGLELVARSHGHPVAATIEIRAGVRGRRRHFGRDDRARREKERHSHDGRYFDRPGPQPDDAPVGPV